MNMKLTGDEWVPGEVLQMTITGQVGGGGLVWGTDVYTEDSVIARAAVHAGVIKNGETKTVFIRILTGISKHDGSERNGGDHPDMRGRAKEL
jgi:hypothetical protein